MKILYKKLIIILVTNLILITNLLGNDKIYNSNKSTNSTSGFGEYVIDTGVLQNYVSNRTNFVSDLDEQTFLIGWPSDNNPSMIWQEGGYLNNRYLYIGHFFIGYNHNCIRFNTLTSNDFSVKKFDPNTGSDILVSFSMTDELAELEHKVGVKCLSKVYAWKNKDIDDFLIYEYSIINNSGKLLKNVYTGLHIDGDISSVAEGDGPLHFARDDQVNFYLGRDKNGNPESITYMYDADNPNIDGEDIGGIFTPKESLGYLGSRVLMCPQSKYGVPANQQSNHHWWDWGSDPLHPATRDEIYDLMRRPGFKAQPGSPHDYRYLQSMGPWDINANDTSVVAYALGIGNGLGGLRKNLQMAYDVYKNLELQLALAPAITYYSPKVNSITTYIGESTKFCLKSEDNVLYRWKINEYLLGNYDSTYTFKATKVHLGENVIVGSVSDNNYTRRKGWIMIVKPAKKFELFQNYPNPFNGSTTIPFELEKDGNVKINIYDILARKVKTLIDKSYTFGKYTITWDGTDANSNPVSSGFYFYQIRTEKYNSTKQMLFMK